jgi:hypothetical protein
MTLTLALMWCAALACERDPAGPDTRTGTVDPRTVATEVRKDSTRQAADTSGALPDTTGTVPDTTGTVPDTTGTVPDTTSAPPDTTGTVPDTTSAPPDTTATPRDSTGTVADTVVAPPTAVAGIWIGTAELAAKPTTGAAWNALKSEADRSCGPPDLSDQDQRNNVCVMAKALVFARTGVVAYRAGVVAAIEAIVGSGTYNGRALALGRELGAYVIAADLIDLQSHAPALDTQFRAKLRELLRTPTTGGPSNLINCHERRPNNWGTHCGGARAAVAAYLGDQAELARVATVFRGWLGDRSAYSGFDYGDLTWQCSSSAPVGINPAGCTKGGNNLDGVIPDDQRRAGSYAWPPPKENYVYEALQGALLQAVVLSRRGYDVWNWQDRALLRAYRWLHDVAGFSADGDDTWQMHIVNRVYGTSFPAPSPTQPGKNVGWTDWTR